jgi:hypothetical protein
MAPMHHDRMMQVEASPFGTIAELVGIAATWNEVDAPDEEALIGPTDWPEFADIHDWIDREAVTDLLISLWSLARPTIGTRTSTTSSLPDRRRDAVVVPIGSSGRGSRRDRTA